MNVRRPGLRDDHATGKLLASETEWLAVRSALAGGALAGGVGVAQWFLGGRADFWVATSSAVLCTVLGLAWGAVGRRRLVPHVAVGLFTALFGSAVVWASLDYLGWLGLVSLISFVVLGRRGGGAWTLVIIGAMTVGLALRVLLVTEATTSDPVPVRALRMGSLVLTLAVISFLYEEQRRRNIDDLERAMAARSRLLAQVSHEMRTPLNGIIGATQALRLDERLHSPEVRDGLDTIEHSGQALLTLINDLLEFARAEAGKTEFERRAFDVRKVVERTVAAYRARATEAGCALDVELPAQPVGALGDAVRLQQVLGNLVSNAVRHGGVGRVLVRLEASERDDQVDLALSVRDEGPGLDAEQRARLFEPFVQLNPRTALGGSGLGLYISRAIARDLGGDLTLDSAQGAGCVFTLSLRLPRAEPDGERASELPSLRGRVLVVDDNPVNLKVASALLQRLGLTVEPVDSGHAALARAGEAVDLVLMDLQMPELDGLETTRRLRAAGFNAPIVALTASALPDTEAECTSAGMSGYLVKPLRLERLLPELARWLPGELSAEGRSRG